MPSIIETPQELQGATVTLYNKGRNISEIAQQVGVQQNN